MLKKLSLIIIFFIGCVFALSACQGNSSADNEIKVGTMTGPETRLMEVAKQVAADQYGLHVQIVEFNDYTLPNTALNDGSIDANMFQHQPYLDALLKAKPYKLIAIGKTFIYPMGIYSQKLKKISAVPKNAVVAIPNDPSNGARALLLLQKAKLITLKDGVTIDATPRDIGKNPKNISIQEIDAAQLPRVLEDVDLAVINSNYAVPAGLKPTKNALLLEDDKSPYANILVVRIAEKDKPKFQQLLAALHSQAVKDEAKKLFQDAAIPAWSEETTKKSS